VSGREFSIQQQRIRSTPSFLICCPTNESGVLLTKASGASESLAGTWIFGPSSRWEVNRAGFAGGYLV
jgi:hypothetical protein